VWEGGRRMEKERREENGEGEEGGENVIGERV